MVPVLSKTKVPLMPCSEKRARKLMSRGEAKPYWTRGIFCIILQRDPKSTHKQEVAVGVDPGSKRTGVTVVSNGNKVVMNFLFNAPHWVKKNVELRKILRRGRRGRKTPYRKCRFNRITSINRIPPSTKARWEAHLRIIRFLGKILPLTDIFIEDIQAKTRKGKRKYNVNFSPLEVGKKYFEKKINELHLEFHKFQGYSTSKWRKAAGYKKTSKKLDDVWEAHNVDSHCLCEMAYCHTIKPSKKIYRCDFLQFSRRQLHVTNALKGGVRKLYGSTISMGIPRGMLVRHPKYELCLIGGNSKGRLSVHSRMDNKRLAQNVKKEDCILLEKQVWTTRLL
jgi:hypothetical protein